MSATACWVSAGPSRCVVDNWPLRQLLARELDFSGIAAASAYAALAGGGGDGLRLRVAQAVTFYQGRAAIDPWFRHRQVVCQRALIWSTCWPVRRFRLVFPPVKVNREYFGDGALRQAAPISPALHLGASRVLVIGVSSNTRQTGPGTV